VGGGLCVGPGPVSPTLRTLVCWSELHVACFSLRCQRDQLKSLAQLHYTFLSLLILVSLQNVSGIMKPVLYVFDPWYRFTLPWEEVEAKKERVTEMEKAAMVEGGRSSADGASSGDAEGSGDGGGGVGRSSDISRSADLDDLILASTAGPCTSSLTRRNLCSDWSNIFGSMPNPST